jgi:hypothetical protein
VAVALVGPALDALRGVYDLAARLQGATDVPEPTVSPVPEQAAFEIAALASLGPLDAQRVLELPDTAARLRALRAHLDETATVLRSRLAEP